MLDALYVMVCCVNIISISTTSVPVIALGTTLRRAIFALGLRPSATPRIQGPHPKGYAQELRPRATLKSYPQELRPRATPKGDPKS
jgi:hypothetical protein